jgi:nucleotide-binding universal stress UspA family protein
MCLKLSNPILLNIFRIKEYSAMTKKILCAVDDTDHAQKAVIYAAELSAKTGAALTICSVNLLQGGLRGPPIYLHDDADIKKILDGAAALAHKNGAKKTSETELKGREVATAVVQFAEQNTFDHIVAGAGHKHGLSRLALGSVALDIVERAHCPVTVAR